YGTPSPVPPPLVKARVAVHPLPQGGEGWDFCLAGVLKCRNSSPRASSLWPVTAKMAVPRFGCGSAALCPP
ncbi:MAG: hypothetical protein ACLQVL_15970, partial [Terriglobia bacterium]